MPTAVYSEPQFLTLEWLISAKLSIYMARGVQRAQDYADVARLTSSNDLPRDFAVEPDVRTAYQKLWDELHKG